MLIKGLTGLYMPGDDPLLRGPQPMAYDPAARWFAAEGIPITPVDDSGQTNPYGLMRISATDTGGKQIGYLDVVVPVACTTSPTPAGIARTATVNAMNAIKTPARCVTVPI